MRAGFNRRTAPKVREGRVQRQNRHVPTVHLGYVLDREAPGHGRHHVVTKRDLQASIQIIPDWDLLSERLERIVLSKLEAADGVYEFYHREETGAIFLCSWGDDLWVELDQQYFLDHRMILERLGVSYDLGLETATCRFTEAQARAFMLLHVFMHELGHHVDRRGQKHLGASRGEEYAERFANSRFESLYPDFVRVFGDPARSS